MRSFSKQAVSLYSSLLFMALALTAVQAQTFRGGISGVVTDESGAAVPGATVQAVDDATGVAHDTISSSAGEFGFQELPLGTYTITASATNFQTVKVDKVPVTAGYIYNLPVKLSVAKTATTIEVDAAALSLGTC